MNLLDLYAKVSIDTSDYERGLESAAESADKFGEHGTNAGGKIDKLQALTVAAGNVMAVAFEKVVEGLGEFVRYATDAAIEYEASFAKVTTIMDDTQMSTGDMSEAIKKLSSQMGISADDISNSVYDVISATGDTANAVNLVESATKLAKGGFAETGSAVSVLTTAINAYGLEMKDAEAISDSLITVQNLGVTTVGDLAGAMGKAIASGSSYGVNLHNLEAGYIALTKAGIGTAEATTYQSSMFKELGDAGSDVGKILKEKTGKSFGELMSDGNSLGDVLKILNDSVDGNSEAFMGLWGSAEAGKGAAAIAGQGFEEFNGWLVQLENSTGATTKAYEIMSDTTKDKLAVLKESFKNLAIDAIEPAIGAFEKFLPKLIEFVQNADAKIKETYTAFNEFKNKVVEVKDKVVEFATDAGDKIKNFCEKIPEGFNKAKEKISEIWSAITSKISDAWETIKNVVDVGLQLVAELISFGGELIMVPFEFIWQNCKDYVTEFIDNVKQFFSDFWSDIVVSFQEGGEGISGILEVLFDTWVNAFTNAMDFIGNLLGVDLSDFTEQVADFVRNIRNNVVEFVDGIEENIKTFFTNLKDKVTSGLDTIKTKFTDAWNNIKDKTVTAYDNLKSKIQSAMDSVKSKIASILDNIKSKFSTIWDNIKSKVSTIVDNIKSKISTGFESIKSTLTSKLESIKTKFSSIMDNLKEKAQNVINKIKSIFDIQIPTPRLKLPHVKVSGQLSLNPPSVPHFSIEWYKKAYDNMFALDGAQIFGALGGKLLGGGEGRGRELIMGEEYFQNTMENALDKTMNKIGGNLGNTTVNITVYGAEGQNVNELAEVIEERISENVRRRGNAWAIA